MGGKQQQPRTIVVVGARAAGKTSLVHRLIDEPADFNSYRPTIDDCYNITWKLPDGKQMHLQVVDTAAWNEFPAMQRLFLKMSHLVLVVYDVVSTTTAELLSLVAEVKLIKSDADIVVVGNKCDNLTKKDNFRPRNLKDVIGDHCVGHVYTSAKSEQGIGGLKQLLLCSKSKLTDGYYTKISQMPKRNKMKKKLHGLAITLRPSNKKHKTSLTTHTENTKPGGDNPLPSFQFTDVASSNFDNLYRSTQTITRYSLASSESSLSESRQSHSLDFRSGSGAPYSKTSKSWASSSSISEYSSSSTSPMSSRYSLNSFELPERRKSMDFSRLELVNDPLDHQSKLCRKKSVSCGDGMFCIPAYDQDFQSSRKDGCFKSDDENPFSLPHASSTDLLRNNNNYAYYGNESDDSNEVYSTSPNSSLGGIGHRLSTFAFGYKPLQLLARKIGRSTEHLDNPRIDYLRQFSKPHGSAEDLLNRVQKIY